MQDLETMVGASGPQLPVLTTDPDEMPEPLDAETVWMVDDYLANHPGGSERLIPLLHRVQGRLGYLSSQVQQLVADKLGMSPIEVYGVVSFYHFFTTVPRGRFQLKICMGTACFVRGGQRLEAALEDALGITVGGVTDDRLFSLEQVRCIGACGLAPAVMVNDEVHGHLDATAVRKLVRRLKNIARKEAAATGVEDADAS